MNYLVAIVLFMGYQNVWSLSMHPCSLVSKIDTRLRMKKCETALILRYLEVMWVLYFVLKAELLKCVIR